MPSSALFDSTLAMRSTHQFSWLWENTQWADFTVDVLPAEADPDTAPLYSLQLQSVVLAAASPGHFRAHCTRLRGQGGGSISVPAGKHRKLTRVGQKRRASDTADQETQSNATVDQAYAYQLTLAPGEPEGVPKAVLCHLYTGALPDDPEQLIWMLRRADYLDLASTVHAILQKLQSVSSEQLTLQHAALLHSLPDLQCDTQQGEAAEQPAAAGPAAASAAGQAAAAAVPMPALAAVAEQLAALVTAGQLTVALAGAVAVAADQALAAALPAAALLQQLIDSLLLAHLPSAPAIVTDAALLAQFTQLPLALVKRWVELDKYEVDSGNALAVLFTAWHDAQPEPPTEQQCKQLSDMLPLAAVSYSFHTHALQHLRWWRGSANLLTSHWLAQQYSGAKGVKGDWFSYAAGATVAQRARWCRDRKWQLTDEQVQQLWDQKTLDLPGFYLMGYILGLKFTLRHKPEDTEQTGPLFLGTVQTMRWSGPVAQVANCTGAPDWPVDMLQYTGAWTRHRPTQGWSNSYTLKGQLWCEDLPLDWIHEQLSFTSLSALKTELSAPAFTFWCQVSFEGVEKVRAVRARA